MQHPEVVVVSWGAGILGGGWEGIQSSCETVTLEETGRVSRTAGDRKVKSFARREPRGSEMGQHMPYKKADTQTEQKRC